MTDKIIPNYKKKAHTCNLFDAGNMIRTHGEKSLHRCERCKKWWFPFQSDPEARWFRVRWFNFGMRRKIRKAERPGR